MERRTFLAACAATAAAPWTRADTGYPSQPIRWVVPYPAGGGTDVLARTVAEAMRGGLGQQIVVDNRPGASTNIGSQIVATAKPDGYTVMSADNALLAYNEHLYRRLPFHPDKDFTYIGGLSRFPLVLVLNPAFAALLVRKLAADGRLHLATDWQDYAEQMWDVLDATPGIVNRAGPRGSVPRPDWRPQTHFETRGQKLGHGVWDLLYDRR